VSRRDVAKAERTRWEEQEALAKAENELHAAAMLVYEESTEMPLDAAHRYKIHAKRLARAVEAELKAKGVEP
jgi:hypothetical protein